MSHLLRTSLYALAFLSLCFAVLSSLSKRTARAQTPTVLHRQFEAGRSALQAGRYGEAIRRFGAVVERQPAFRVPTRGAVASWLGRAHLARGDSAAAHSAWRRGLEALDAEGAFDVRLADAYLRSVFRLARTDEQAAAANTYLHLLAHAGSRDLTAPERRLVRRHVAQMIFLLPEAVQARVTPDAEALMNEGAALYPEAGEALAAWWRRRDPLPASLGNERVVEHLERVAHAERHYAHRGLLGRHSGRPRPVARGPAAPGATGPRRPPRLPAGRDDRALRPRLPAAGEASHPAHRTGRR